MAMRRQLTVLNEPDDDDRSGRSKFNGRRRHRRRFNPRREDRRFLVVRGRALTLRGMVKSPVLPTPIFARLISPILAFLYRQSLIGVDLPEQDGITERPGGIWLGSDGCRLRRRRPTGHQAGRAAVRRQTVDGGRPHRVLTAMVSTTSLAVGAIGIGSSGERHRQRRFAFDITDSPSFERMNAEHFG